MAGSDQDLDYFGETFAESRAKFLLAAAQTGGAASSYIHPDATGPDGGILSIEVACFGPAQAAKTLIVISGTHGGEGYAGSAAQIAFMRSGDLAKLPPDLRVVLVHGLNPFGFAHWTRTTEHNVDLNRNFIDFAAPTPRNPGYGAVHDLLCPPEWSQAIREETQRGIERWIQQNGFQAWMQAIMMGQYDDETGLIYGGKRREWSNETLQRIVERHAAGSEKVAYVDWHTGLGRRGEPFFICFNEPGGEGWKRACDWWGRDQVETKEGYDGAERPKYVGLVFHGVERFVAPAKMVGAVIEFGTQPLAEAFDQLRIDRWLKFGKVPNDPARLAALRRGVRDSFTPPEADWRRSIVGHARRIQRQALDGLAAW